MRRLLGDAFAAALEAALRSASLRPIFEAIMSAAPKPKRRRAGPRAIRRTRCRYDGAALRKIRARKGVGRPPKVTLARAAA